MKKRNNAAAPSSSEVRCVEVLVPKKFIAGDSSNLGWTLAVYSLENQALKHYRFLHNSEVFHFMEYDWKKTIQQLLEESQVPYVILQYFNNDLFRDDVVQAPDVAYIAAMESFEESVSDI